MQEGATPAKALSLREQVFTCSLSFFHPGREQTVKVFAKARKFIAFPRHLC